MVRLNFKATNYNATWYTRDGEIHAAVWISYYADQPPIVSADVHDFRGVQDTTVFANARAKASWHDYLSTSSRGDKAIAEAFAWCEAEVERLEGTRVGQPEQCAQPEWEQLEACRPAEVVL